jgi:hypothetical protein
MHRILFEIIPYDPKVLLRVAAIIAAALFTCTIPGLRAATIDPMVPFQERVRLLSDFRTLARSRGFAVG